MEQTKAIEEGDTVRLKSGGPLMTATKIAGETVEVSWFYDGISRPLAGSFPRNALIRSEETDRFPTE